ncbi:MAG: Hsp20/alpha crystallin family protein [Saprospiraceae bacterium]
MRQLVRRRNHGFPAFAKVVNDIFNDDFVKNLDESLSVWNGSQPAVNVKEDGDGFYLALAAPGYGKEDIEIKIDDNVLTISSEKKEDTTAKEGEKFTRKEFKYAAFKRTFTLPDTVDAAKIGANYENGILNISIPKKEEAKPLPVRTINIA